jgi:hypothetical protein
MSVKARSKFFFADDFDAELHEPLWEYHSAMYAPVTTYLADENEAEELEELLDKLHVHVYSIRIS